MLTILNLFNLPGLIGVADLKGTYRLDFEDGSSRLATPSEIAEADAALVVAVAAEKLANTQQTAAIIEAKRAYARLQNIIDLVDNSTIVQLKSAVKQIAIDVQHLIRASVR